VSRLTCHCHRCHFTHTHNYRDGACQRYVSTALPSNSRGVARVAGPLGQRALQSRRIRLRGEYRAGVVLERKEPRAARDERATWRLCDKPRMRPMLGCQLWLRLPRNLYWSYYPFRSPDCPLQQSRLGRQVGNNPPVRIPAIKFSPRGAATKGLTIRHPGLLEQLEQLDKSLCTIWGPFGAKISVKAGNLSCWEGR